MDDPAVARECSFKPTVGTLATRASAEYLCVVLCPPLLPGSRPRSHTAWPFASVCMVAVAGALSAADSLVCCRCCCCPAPPHPTPSPALCLCWTGWLRGTAFGSPDWRPNGPRLHSGPTWSVPLSPPSDDGRRRWTWGAGCRTRPKTPTRAFRRTSSGRYPRRGDPRAAGACACVTALLPSPPPTHPPTHPPSTCGCSVSGSGTLLHRALLLLTRGPVALWWCCDSCSAKVESWRSSVGGCPSLTAPSGRGR
jgi:hypothetical protein